MDLSSLSFEEQIALAEEVYQAVHAQQETKNEEIPADPSPDGPPSPQAKESETANVRNEEKHVELETLKRVLAVPSIIKHINSFLLSYEVLENMLALRPVNNAPAKPAPVPEKRGKARGRMWRRMSSFPVANEGHMAAEVTRQHDVLNESRTVYVQALANLDAMKKRMSHAQMELDAIQHTSWFMHALQIAKLKAACKKLKIAGDMELSAATRLERMHKVNEELRKDLTHIQQAINARASTQTQLKSTLSAGAKMFEDTLTAPPIAERQPLVSKQQIPELVAAAESIIHSHSTDIVSREKARIVRLLTASNQPRTKSQWSVLPDGKEDRPETATVTPTSPNGHSLMNEKMASIHTATEKQALAATQTMARMCVAALEAIDQRATPANMMKARSTSSRVGKAPALIAANIESRSFAIASSKQRMQDLERRLTDNYMSIANRLDTITFQALTKKLEETKGKWDGYVEETKSQAAAEQEEEEGEGSSSNILRVDTVFLNGSH